MVPVYAGNAERVLRVKAAGLSVKNVFYIVFYGYSILCMCIKLCIEIIMILHISLHCTHQTVGIYVYFYCVFY